MVLVLRFEEPAKFRSSSTATAEVCRLLPDEIGALKGAVLTFAASAGGKSNLKVVPIGLIRPDGVAVSLVAGVQQKATSFRLTSLLNASGTWKLRLGAVTGLPAPVSWTYTVRQPRGVVFSVE